MIHVTLLSHTFEMMLKDGDVGIGSVSILYVERRSLEEKDTFHIKSRT